MNNLQYCRLCLTKCKKMINLFDENGKEINIASIIEQHFFKILESDLISTVICKLCWNIVDNFHTFFTKINEAQIEWKHSSFGQNDGTIKLEHIKVEEYLDPNMLFSECDFEVQENVLNQTDSLDMMEYEQLYTTTKELLKNPLTDENTKIQKPKKHSRSRSKPIENYAQTRDEIEQIEQENKLIRQFCQMECEFCNHMFSKFAEVGQHYRTHHNKKRGYLRCCGQQLRTRLNALDHVMRHVNPEVFKCPHCAKILKSKHNLKYHIANRHNTEQFQCTQCSSSFGQVRRLKQHMRVIHFEEKDKTFICDDCGKSFHLKQLLTSHIRLEHQMAFACVCEFCAKVFKEKKLLLLHQRTHTYDESMKVQCDICGVWLKHKTSLKQHFQYHVATEQVCPVCNKTFPHKRSMKRHIRNVHTDALFQCSICPNTFKTSNGLKEHISRHTGNFPYVCPFCPNKYPSNAQMYAHKNRHHSNEVDKTNTIELAQ